MPDDHWHAPLRTTPRSPDAAAGVAILNPSALPCSRRFDYRGGTPWRRNTTAPQRCRSTRTSTMRPRFIRRGATSPSSCSPGRRPSPSTTSSSWPVHAKLVSEHRRSDRAYTFTSSCSLAFLCFPFSPLCPRPLHVSSCDNHTQRLLLEAAGHPLYLISAANRLHHRDLCDCVQT